MENKSENTNKKKVKFDLKNISPEERNKYIAYAFFGVAVIGIFTYGISNYTSEDKSEEVTEFSNIESEQSKYNSKLEAMHPKTEIEASNNLENTYTPTEGSSQDNTDVDFQALDKQLAEIGSGSNAVQNTPKQSSTGSGGSHSNSHDVYGNYSMWQDKEPSNSKIGYAKKNPVIASSQPRQSSAPSYTEVKNYQPEPTTYKEPSFSPYEEKKAVQIAQVKSKLISQGEASNGRSISFVILESFTLNGETIAKSKSYAIGSIKIENNRIFAKINSVKSNGKTYNVSGNILGYDGEEGLPLSVNEETGNASGVLKDEAGRIINNVPIVGGVISRATSGGGRSKANKISLSGNIECTLIIYK